jgi:hypothetical protein
MRRAPLLLLAIPAIAGTFGACGGGGETVTIGASAAAIRDAGQATLAADSARLEMTMTMEAAGFPGLDVPLEITASGVTDFAGGTSVVDVDMSGMFDAFSALAPEGEGLGALEGMGHLRQIQDGTVLYQCGGMYEMVAGAECVRIDLAEVPGFDASQVGGASPADATALLESLQGADGEVEEVGVEEVDGVRTTHLRGSFTLAGAIGDLPDDTAADLEQAYEQFGLDGRLDEPQQVDVWIDDEGRVRKLRQELSFGDAMGALVEVRYSDFGVEVDPDIPDDAVDLSEVVPDLGGLID